MKLNLFSPKHSLNKAYLKEKVNRDDIELFKKNLTILYSKINEQESEEHHKYPVKDFLKDTWYKDQFEINTKGRSDFVIHSGKTTKDPVGVIIEIKRPTNKSEMMSAAKPNAKAMHELILYYLQERIIHQNTGIKYLIATNIYEWFIIDEVWFDKNVYRNTKLKKQYEEDFKQGGHDTKFFYDSIAKPFLETLEEPVPCTYFNFRDFETVISNKDQKDDNQLIALYKILSPAHLLKQAFGNDSNSLDPRFYTELLHIIGLEEIKDGGKKLIKRKQKPDDASLLENTILKLEDKESLRNLPNLSQYGSSRADQLFNVALELCITWVNRVLFLKLLEAQLYNYHKGKTEYQFLETNLIHDYDELNNLFFQVLAEKPATRKDNVKDKFSKIPYLNSSLFERTELERKTFDIGGLDNRLELPLASATVLKNDSKRRTGRMLTLTYLFEFLNAYDFTSEGSEEIQEENKNLINASVLGLIFEKINGYKDGSFFTPGFITMYMCRETIRRAVVQKFNEKHNINCETFEDLKNFVSRKFKQKDILEHNALINSLKICDPAVGSGHFLVSALNELIAIKAELNILADKEGLLLGGYEVKIENDELIITYNSNTEIFEYTLTGNSVDPKIQRVQKTLFHEKETLIENCLFGVDINPNSVKICRLRLWIELLKNAYYTEESKFQELETLPNIDINIKCGNSLISRFGLDADLGAALKKSKWNIDSYRLAVHTYHNAQTKEQKREMEQLIEDIKGNFRSEISNNDPKIARKNKLGGDLYNLVSQVQVFELSPSEKKERKKKQEKLEQEVNKLSVEIEEIKSNKIYENAFEWRFEFPEVLDNEGGFVGFDVVIGNPPWGAELTANALNHIKNENEDIIVRMVDTFMFFINLDFKLKNDTGLITQIIPDVLLYQIDNEKLREKILSKYQLHIAANLGDNIFEDVARASCIIMIGSTKNNLTEIFEYRKSNNIHIEAISKVIVNTTTFSQLPNMIFATRNLDGYSILSRLNESKLIELVDKDGIQRGISPDLKEAFIIDDSIISSNNLEPEFIFPTITGGRDTKKYYSVDIGKRIIYTKRDDDTSSIANIIEYISKFKKSITCKEVKEGKHPFWALHRARCQDIFIKNEKILGVITGDKVSVSLDDNWLYPTDGLYLFSSNGIYSNLFLVGLLNSKLITYLYRLISMEENRALAQIKPSILEQIPVSKKFNKEAVEKIEHLSKNIIDKVKSGISDYTVEISDINKLTYILYELSEAEIKIVEGYE